MTEPPKTSYIQHNIHPCFLPSVGPSICVDEKKHFFFFLIFCVNVQLAQLPDLTHFSGHMKAKACTKQAVRAREPKGQISLFCNSVDLCWTQVQSYQEVCKLWSSFTSCHPLQPLQTSKAEALAHKNLWTSPLNCGCSTADYKDGHGLGDHSTQSAFASLDADGTWNRLGKNSTCPLGTT